MYLTFVGTAIERMFFFLVVFVSTHDVFFFCYFLDHLNKIGIDLIAFNLFNVGALIKKLGLGFAGSF